MATVFGPGIALPQGMAANAVLQIDTEIIQQRILRTL